MTTPTTSPSTSITPNWSSSLHFLPLLLSSVPSVCSFPPLFRILIVLLLVTSIILSICLGFSINLVNIGFLSPVHLFCLKRVFSGHNHVAGLTHCVTSTFLEYFPPFPWPPSNYRPSCPKWPQYILPFCHSIIESTPPFPII